MIGKDAYIDNTAIVSSQATIGERTKIWHYSHVREGAVIGDDCIVGDYVYIDCGVKIGSKVKVQNSALLYKGVEIEDNVFIGPGVVFTNDKYPRATNARGELSKDQDWVLVVTKIKHGASIGANATILCGITVGRYALVGCGAVVTKNVPDFALVLGNPARVVGRVCKCAKPFILDKPCTVCGVN